MSLSHAKFSIEEVKKSCSQYPNLQNKRELGVKLCFLNSLKLYISKRPLYVKFDRKVSKVSGILQYGITPVKDNSFIENVRGMLRILK